jgi:hypothetical protein
MSAQLDVQKGAIPVDFFGVIFVSVILIKTTFVVFNAEI